MLRKCLKMPLRARIDPKMLPMMYSTAAAVTSEDEVLFKTLGAVREITLNRPKKLNAINDGIINLLTPRLHEYAKSDLAGILVLKGAGGKALSAGGDVAALAVRARDQGLQEAANENSEFFRQEFGVNHHIATYSKPFVSLLDGITMGGGVGLTVHGSFRIATDKTLLAMPETTIGYYPDVGGIWFLAKLDEQFGLYMALTSQRITGYDNYILGIATHFVGSESLPDLVARLSELTPEGKASTPQYFDLVNRAIEDFSSEPAPNYKPGEYLKPENREIIAKCFKYDTAEEIVGALKLDGSEFALNAAKTIEQRCPLSVKVTLAAFRRFKNLDIHRAFVEEMNVCDHFMRDPNFPEGVLSLLVDKRKPNWQPATLAEVPEATVESFFEPTKETLPVNFANDRTFKDYPHKFGLPSIADVKAFVIGETSTVESKATRQDVQTHFRRAIGEKSGLEQHIDSILQTHTKGDPSDPQLLDWLY